MQTPSTATTHLPSTNVNLFLRHLRILDLDQVADYPHDLLQTFTAKPHVSNQKRRVQCTEWVLYQLFVLWNQETARNKLRPFFPPLAPLQSVNLRAALIRCLTDIKKDGVLGRYVMIRKTMLDECTGERLLGVLVAFSTAVVRKRVAERESSGKTIAGRLATSQTLSVKDRESMLPLAIAHKGSMSALLRRKENERRSWKAFRNTMDEQECSLRKREVDVQEPEARKDSTRPPRGLSGLRGMLQEHWQGDSGWLDVVIHGEEPHDLSIFNQTFDHAWRVDATSPETENEEAPLKGLLEQLESRVEAQQTRVRKWKEYHAQHASPTKTPKVPKAWGSPWKTPRATSGFTPGGYGAGGMTSTPLMTKRYQDFFRSSHAEGEDYDHAGEGAGIVEDGLARLEMPESRSHVLGPVRTPQGWTPVTHVSRQALEEIHARLPQAEHAVPQHSALDGSTPCPTRPKPSSKVEEISEAPNTPSTDATSDLENWSDPESTPVHDLKLEPTEPSYSQQQHTPLAIKDAEPSKDFTFSAQPKQLSLIERTRQSIAFSTIDGNSDAFLPDSSPTSMLRPAFPQPTSSSQQSSVPTRLGRRTSLLDRTRQSISSVSARPRASRSSILSQNDRATFPVNQFQTPRKTSPEKQLGLDPVAEEGRGKGVKVNRSEDKGAAEEDYESVFKSRPRVGMSPVEGTPTPMVEAPSVL